MSNNKNCDSWDSCNFCDSCYFCNSCNFCDSCYFCYYSKGLRMSEKMIFCLGDGRYESRGEGYQKNHRVFNKDVSEKEYGEIRDSLDIKLKLTKSLDVYSYKDAWENWWKESSDKQKKAITDIKYFDKKIFKEITGLDVDKEEKIEELTMAEICKELGREIKVKK